MKQEQILFQVESDVADNLLVGALIDLHTDGSIIMKQEGLTKRVVKALFLNNNSTDATIVQTPATTYLPFDDNSETEQGLYNYVVSILVNYLQDHSRIDITFPVSQVARYVHSPKRSHKLALERIGCHLKGTLDKGLIL